MDNRPSENIVNLTPKIVSLSGLTKLIEAAQSESRSGTFSLAIPRGKDMGWLVHRILEMTRADLTDLSSEQTESIIGQLRRILPEDSQNITPRRVCEVGLLQAAMLVVETYQSCRDNLGKVCDQLCQSAWVPGQVLPQALCALSEDTFAGIMRDRIAFQYTKQKIRPEVQRGGATDDKLAGEHEVDKGLKKPSEPVDFDVEDICGTDRGVSLPLGQQPPVPQALAPVQDGAPHEVLNAVGLRARILFHFDKIMAGLGFSQDTDIVALRAQLIGYIDAVPNVEELAEIVKVFQTTEFAIPTDSTERTKTRDPIMGKIREMMDGIFLCLFREVGKKVIVLSPRGGFEGWQRVLRAYLSRDFTQRNPAGLYRLAAQIKAAENAETLLRVLACYMFVENIMQSVRRKGGNGKDVARAVYDLFDTFVWPRMKGSVMEEEGAVGIEAVVDTSEEGVNEVLNDAIVRCFGAGGYDFLRSDDFRTALKSKVAAVGPDVRRSLILVLSDAVNESQLMHILHEFLPDVPGLSDELIRTEGPPQAAPEVTTAIADATGVDTTLQAAATVYLGSGLLLDEVPAEKAHEMAATSVTVPHEVRGKPGDDPTLNVRKAFGAACGRVVRCTGKWRITQGHERLKEEEILFSYGLALGSCLKKCHTDGDFTALRMALTVASSIEDLEAAIDMAGYMRDV